MNLVMSSGDILYVIGEHAIYSMENCLQLLLMLLDCSASGLSTEESSLLSCRRDYQIEVEQSFWCRNSV